MTDSQETATPTGTTRRIRWEAADPDREWCAETGTAGTAAEPQFRIYGPGSGDEKWLLVVRLLGKDTYRYGDGRDEVKDAAEEVLEEFVTSLGAVFPGDHGEFEFPRDSIDLESAFAPGAYVRYQHPDAGWEDDQKAGRKLLTHGRLYRVAWNDIGQSKTRIGLVGAEGSFNSVLFEPVADEDVTDAEAAEVARRSAPATTGEGQ